MRHRILFVAAIASALLPACHKQPLGEAPPESLPPLKQSVEGIWKDAGISSDAEYQAVTKLSAEGVAPLDMRTIIVNWPKPRDVRDLRRKLTANFEKEHVTLAWTAEIACGEEDEPARQRFLAMLTKQGYRPADTNERNALALTTPLISKEGDLLIRQVGETELIVSFGALPYSGSDTFLSGVRFTWLARCPSRAPDTLTEAFDALPAWMKVKHLDDQFYSSIADEPVTSLASGGDLWIKFARPVTDKLVKALEQNGFEYDCELSPKQDGSTQKQWYRFSDVTFASIISTADGKTQTLFCQMPQHDGPPITDKPPPQHPSLKLPPEKRPILSLDQLPLGDGELRRQAKLFHALAESIAQKDWKVEGYKDERWSPHPWYVAQWQTSVVKSTYYVKRDRPYHGITIRLSGENKDASDHLKSLGVSGVSVPAAGWAAQASYYLSISDDGQAKKELLAIVALVGNSEPFSFDGTQLTVRYVSASVSEGNRSYSYAFYAQLPQANFERAARMLCNTPETLRDEFLADIDSLRKHAREQFDSGLGMTMTDWRDVRSDRPPQKEPISQRPPSEETKQALWAEVEKYLARQENVIRENFREIHAAVRRALPMDTLLDKLNREDP